MTIKRHLLYRDKLLFRLLSGNVCAFCGRESTHVEVDHITPLWNGGKDDFGNLQVLCYECHKKKSVNELREWHKLHPFTIIRNGVVING